MNKFCNIVVIIPAYNPDEKLLHTIESLHRAGFVNLIVVNDGSNEECQAVFASVDMMLKQKNGGVLLKHSVNLGQGRAYKTAFNYYLGHYPDCIGVVQCDADGQHHIEDIVKCANLLLENPDKFIIGERSFNSESIPFRSRFGNKCTSFVFRFFCGIDLEDTQTGLKGIPHKVIYYLIETPGERFEYATSVLLELKKRNIPIQQFPIQTIYINENESSHFNPIMDSVRIYSTIFKFLASSLMTVGIDLFVFTIMIAVLKKLFDGVEYIFLSNAIAKVFSGIFNFLFNKKVVFSSTNDVGKESVKYILLCITHIVISSSLVSLMSSTVNLPEVVAKMLIDVVLFFIIYYVQRTWIFRSRR